MSVTAEERNVLLKSRQGEPDAVRMVNEKETGTPIRLPSRLKALSLALKAVVIFSAVIGTCLSYAAGRNSFMGGRQVFMYFTIQSNLLMAILCLAGAAFLLRNRAVPAWWYVLKLVGTVSITLTGVVFAFVLAPTLGRFAWNVQNTLTHVVVPITSVLDFFVTGICGRIPKRSIVYVTIPPAAYAVYAGIAYLSGWEFARGVHYPYFFLNWGSPAGAFGFTNELPFMGSAWWILAILLFLLAVGTLYLRLLDALRKRLFGKPSRPF